MPKIFETVQVISRLFILSQRLELVDRRLENLTSLDLFFKFRAIEKKRYKVCLDHSFGQVVQINPYLAAFVLLSNVINDCLQKHAENRLFISDENKPLIHDLEKCVKTLRFGSGTA